MSKLYKMRVCLPEGHLANQTFVLPAQLLPILEPEKMTQLLVKHFQAAGAQQKEGHWQIEKAGVRFQINGTEFEVSLVKQGFDVMIDEERLTFIQKQNILKGINQLQIDDVNAPTLPVMERKFQQDEQTFINGMTQGREMLNSLMKEVYQEAIQIKAQSLGNVTVVSESQDNDEYRIRLEIQA